MTPWCKHWLGRININSQPSTNSQVLVRICHYHHLDAFGRDISNKRATHCRATNKKQGLEKVFCQPDLHSPIVSAPWIRKGYNCYCTKSQLFCVRRHMTHAEELNTMAIASKQGCLERFMRCRHHPITQYWFLSIHKRFHDHVDTSGEQIL